MNQIDSFFQYDFFELSSLLTRVILSSDSQNILVKPYSTTCSSVTIDPQTYTCITETKSQI
ncbi:hypothetical protein HanRHA438_Chr10g0473951 [Helianthus annuus]|nr:hypothetical protein HanRHA438_Chr10g0473951 [Helianthus annuus]